MVAVWRRGAFEVLASTYVDETLWGRFLFLDSTVSDSFATYFETTARQLSQKFGTPAEIASPTYLLWGDTSEQRVWKVGGRQLILELHSQSGDGDFDYQLWLAVVER